MEVSRQECWSGLPFPSPEDLLDQGIESAFLAAPALAGIFFATSITWEAHIYREFNTNILYPGLLGSPDLDSSVLCLVRNGADRTQTHLLE